MLSIEASNNLGNGRMLVVATDSRMPNNPKEYYSVKEENVNTFIKDRKAVDFSNRFQRTLSIALGFILGAFAGIKVNSNPVVKSVLGVAAGYGGFKACQKLDNKSDSTNIKAMLKRNDAKDITKEMICGYQQH